MVVGRAVKLRGGYPTHTIHVRYIYQYIFLHLVDFDGFHADSNMPIPWMPRSKGKHTKTPSPCGGTQTKAQVSILVVMVLATWCLGCDLLVFCSKNWGFGAQFIWRFWSNEKKDLFGRSRYTWWFKAVTFLGWWVHVTLLRGWDGWVTSNDRGWKGHGLNHLVYIVSFWMSCCLCFLLFV